MGFSRLKHGATIQQRLVTPTLVQATNCLSDWCAVMPQDRMSFRYVVSIAILQTPIRIPYPVDSFHPLSSPFPSQGEACAR